MIQKIYTIVTCGTAGHVFPALELVSYMINQKIKVNLIMDKISGHKYAAIINAFKNNYLTILYVTPCKLNFFFPYFFLKNIIEEWKMITATDLIICFIAGLHLPLLCLASILGKKFILHEQDSILNYSNRIFQIFAFKIFTSFKKVQYLKNDKGLWIGCPITQKYQNDLDINLEKKMITILGGTNGAECFDRILSKELIKIKELEDYEVYHNCRIENITYLQKFYKENNINAHVSNFFHDFELLIRDSKILITRGGASTISYLNLYNKKVIMIPWGRSSQNHQYHNGMQLAAQGILILSEQKLFLIKEYIQKLLSNQNKENQFQYVFKSIPPKEYYQKISDIIY
jgi:UDP-N-acetylglucosamine--N-acetylmuramyl-(pentapeptide) pyrophosphoryl-undecaprenol N-acetylglucosamine transferase